MMGGLLENENQRYSQTFTARNLSIRRLEDVNLLYVIEFNQQKASGCD